MTDKTRELFEAWRDDNTKYVESLTAYEAFAHQQAIIDLLAKIMHYPGCWDTVAYPTLADAVNEAYECSECSRTTTKEQGNG